MVRTLRAFAWMRWRVFLNSLERTGARDVVERLSLAVEQIAPIIALLLLVPSGVVLAGAAAYSGFALGRGEQSLVFEVLGYLLFGASGLALLGPLILQSGSRANLVRLLLLPITRPTLYVSQTLGSIVEPWILLAVPVFVSLPVGLLAAGAPAAAGVATLAGGLLLAALLGLSSLASLVLQLVMRDRRRGELAALILILVIPLVSMAPGVLAGRSGDFSSWARYASAAAEYAPSALFATAIRRAAGDRALFAAAALVPLAITAAALHALAFLVFDRLLDSPSSGTSRRTSASSGPWRLLPGVSTAASAIALAQVRLTLRTPRGRSILLSPLLVFCMFALLMRVNPDEMEMGFVALNSGIGLATFGSAVCLISVLPFAMNQFAIDGAGLTLMLLSPVRDDDLLAGKAIGNAIVAGGPALLCMLAALAILPGGPPALWLAIPPGLASTYLLAAPAAAALSVLFPRAVDLNSIGRGSNAHGLAGFVGLLAFVAAGAPAVLLSFSVLRLLDRPAFLPAILLGWCAVAFFVSRLLFRPVRTLLRTRRENLALVV